MKIITFTKEGLENCRKELEDLISKRPIVVKALSNARDMGDLSENGLYKAAKQELVDLDRNIRNLKYLIKHGKVLAPKTLKSIIVQAELSTQMLKYFFE